MQPIKLTVSKRTSALCAVFVGVALELGVYASTGRREAWDSSQYWTIGLPLAGLASVAIGYLSRGNDWIWTLVVIPSQVTTMMVRNGELGGLWPLTMVLAALLSAPFLAAAFIGSRFRPKRT